MNICTFLKYIKDVLINSDMPVWMTLLIMAVGAGITYFLIPYFNEEFEKEKIRTSYVISSMETLNNESVDFLNLLKRYNNSNLRKDNEIYQKLEDSITKLQWKIFELNATLGGSFNSEDVDNYINSLISITNELRKPDSYDRAYALCEAAKFVQASNNIIGRIADIVDLNIGETADPLNQIKGECRDIVAPPVPSKPAR